MSGISGLGDRSNEELNPLGIHYLKFCVAILLIAVHYQVFVRLSMGIGFGFVDSLKLRILACLPSSLIIPFTAGATQGLLLSENVVNGRLQKLTIGPLAKALLLLAFLESFKAMITMPSIFFGWNVLHMIAVSLILTLLLARISIYVVALSAALCLIATSPLREFFRRFEVSTPTTLDLLNANGANQTAVHLVLILLFAIGVSFVVLKLKPEPKFKQRSLVLLLFLYGVASAVAYFVEPNYYFAARLLNLPAGAMVGDSLGLHYWPLFPWYSSVAIGFCLYVPWSKIRAQRWIAAALVIPSIIFIYYWIGHLPARSLPELDSKNLWNFRTYSGSLMIFAFSLALFAAYAGGCALLADAKWLRRMNQRWPALLKVPIVYSKTIVWSYFFVNTAGLGISYLAARVLPPILAVTLFPVVMVISWYWLGSWILKALTTNRFSIRISRLQTTIG